MAWTAPTTFVSTSVLTAAVLNAQLRDNMLETEAGKAVDVFRPIVSTGANAVTQRPVADHVVESPAGETSTSTTYGDLATVGPTVTVTTGAKAAVFINAQISNDTANQASFASVAISGATTLAADDDYAILAQSTGATIAMRAGIMILFSLTAGVNTFTMKYRRAGGNASFEKRRLQVWAL